MDRVKDDTSLMPSVSAGPGDLLAGPSGERDGPRSGVGPAGSPPPIPLDRRSAILGQARALFLARGYAAISMQQIADSTGINKATLYHHFRDKDDLFLAVLARELDEVNGRIAGAIAAGGGLRAILARVALVSLEMTQADFRSLFASLKHEVDPDRRAVFFLDREYPWLQLRPVFAEAMAAGAIAPGDPEICIELFLSMTHSQAPNAIRRRPAPDPAAVAPYLAALFIDGMAGSGPMPNGLTMGCAVERLDAWTAPAHPPDQGRTGDAHGK